MMRAIVTTALLFGAIAAAGDPGEAMLDWPYVGGDQSHAKYSVADDVTAANVGELEIVWRWAPDERPLPE